MVADQVGGVVGAVGHHRRAASPWKRSSPERSAHPKPLGWCEGRQRPGGARRRRRRRSRRCHPALGVVDHEDLVLDFLRLEGLDRGQNRVCDRSLLVVGGDDDRELHAVQAQRRRDGVLVGDRPSVEVGETPAVGLRGATSVAREEPPAVGDVERHVPGPILGAAPMAPRCRSARGRAAVVSSSERLTSRPPPTLPTNPLQRSGRRADSISSNRSAKCSRSRTCLPAAAKPM